MKKIMILGGSTANLPAIKKSKELGHYVIICDYLPNNPGKEFADKWYDASTTDYEAVLKVAKDEKIDGIMCYCSDMAASTAAYVAEKLNLPTSPYESIYTLTHKDKFREFLRENGFNAPKSKSFLENEYEDAKNYAMGLGLPIMIKPVDSQGSRGITKITSISQIDDAIDFALSKSLSKRIIIEQYIENSYMYLDGDMFTVNGKIENITFFNRYLENYDTKVQTIPLGQFFPCIADEKILSKVKFELQRLVSLLNMKTQAYNIEVSVLENGDIYIIEIGPRNGGNMIPYIINTMTGFDEISASICATVGDEIPKFELIKTKYYWGLRILYSNTSGILKEIWFDENFKKNNLYCIEQYAKVNDIIHEMKGSNDTIATIAAKFETLNQVLDFEKNTDKYCMPIVNPLQ